MSGKKDALVNIGGWLALSDQRLYEEASNLVDPYEGLHTYGGMAGRDMEAMARGIVESVADDHIRARIGQVEYLGRKLIDAGVPVVRPIGCHAVYLDAKVFYPQLDQEQFPAQALAAYLYEDSGVRSMERGIVSAGRDGQTGRNRHPALELVRLTIPRRVYTQAHMDLTAESVIEVYEQRARAKGLAMVYEPRHLRFFQARFERRWAPVGGTRDQHTGISPSLSKDELALRACDRRAQPGMSGLDRAIHCIASTHSIESMDQAIRSRATPCGTGTRHPGSSGRRPPKMPLVTAPRRVLFGVRRTRFPWASSRIQLRRAAKWRSSSHDRYV